VIDSYGFSLLFESPGNTGDHRLYPSFDEQRVSFLVRTVALDRVPELRPPVDFVKLDVQGTEQAAVRGMERLLAASPDVTIALEHWPFGMARFGSDARGALAYYRSLGFSIRTYVPGRDDPISLNDDEILDLCSEWDGFGHADIVLRRGECESAPCSA
jgi:hypothetical protein